MDTVIKTWLISSEQLLQTLIFLPGPIVETHHANVIPASHICTHTFTARIIEFRDSKLSLLYGNPITSGRSVCVCVWSWVLFICWNISPRPWDKDRLCVFPASPLCVCMCTCSPPPTHEYGKCVSPANGQDKGLRVNKTFYNYKLRLNHPNQSATIQSQGLSTHSHTQTHVYSIYSMYCLLGSWVFHGHVTKKDNDDWWVFF